MTETPDQATRRRWVTLAEVIAVAGVLIAAATLYLGWSQRRDEAADKQAAQVAEDKAANRVTLTATVEDDGQRLALADAGNAVATISVAFPPASKVPTQTDVAPPRIEAAWLAKQILKMTDGGPDERRGGIPIVITSRWSGSDDRPHSDTAIYDLVWHTEGRTLRGRVFKLDGLILRERGGSRSRLAIMWLRP